ncbi:MAG: hypothetical protein LR015_12855 [Verrucomicrobia bacterium]|nr:hypothetical protein [Verrucomicrobiota bacterium]
MSGKVRSGTVVLDKAGREVSVDVELEVMQPPRFCESGRREAGRIFA